MPRCPLCAAEIEAGALRCRSCGVVLESAPAEATAGSGADNSPSTAPPRAAARLPVGEVREGVVATRTQALGFRLHGLAVDAVLLLVVLSWLGVRSLDWGRQATGPIVMVARPAPIFLIGAFAAFAAWTLGVRRLVPRVRDAGAKAVRGFRRALQEQHGIGLLLARRGLVAGAATCLLIWAGLEAVAVWNFAHAGDLGWEVMPGLYAAVVLPVIGALGAVLVLDGRGGRVVRLDSKGDLCD